VLLLLAAACHSAAPGADPPDAPADDGTPTTSDELRVFPGAEGFGVYTEAGRGGAILVVDSLAAEGPGTLGEALATPGPRVVVFAVAGTIWLEQDLLVTEPFLTLAGQTAPSPGVTLAGAGLRVATHDVLVQHLRARAGDRAEGPDPEVRDSLMIAAGERGSLSVRDVVLDHCSASWGIDETASTTWTGVSDVTFSHSLIAESLDDSLHPEGPHGKGFVVSDGTRRVALVRNVLAFHEDRNPLVKGDTSVVVANTFVYDPGRWPVTFFDDDGGTAPLEATLVGNAFVAGVDTPPDDATVYIDESVHEDSRIYLDDVVSWDSTGDPWDSVEGGRRRAVRVDEPPLWPDVLTLLPAAEVEAALLDTVGARPADRDAVDTRIINQIRSRTGAIVDSQDEVGGWPDLGEVRREPDLPADPWGDADRDGWTDMDEWLAAEARKVGG